MAQEKREGGIGFTSYFFVFVVLFLTFSLLVLLFYFFWFSDIIFFFGSNKRHGREDEWRNTFEYPIVVAFFKLVGRCG